MRNLAYSQIIEMTQSQVAGLVLPLESWESHDIGAIAFPCIIGSRLTGTENSSQSSNYRYLRIDLSRPVNRMIWIGLLLRDPVIRLEGQIISNVEDALYRLYVKLVLEGASEKDEEFYWLSSASTSTDVSAGTVNISIQNATTLLNWMHSPQILNSLRLKLEIGIGSLSGSFAPDAETELTAKLLPGEIFSQIVVSNALKCLRELPS